MQPQAQQPQPPVRSRKKNRWLLVPLLLGAVIAAATYALSPSPGAVTHGQRRDQADPAALAASSLPGATTARGNIYDRNFSELALSYKTSAAYVRPLELDDPGVAAARLAEVLELEPEKLAADFKSERVVIWLGRDLEKARAEAIGAAGLKGVYLVDEQNRLYPHRGRAAQLLGFANSEQGLDGLEFFYDPLLRGSIANEALAALVEGSGPAGGSREPLDLVLTLDLRLQASLEQMLATLAKKSGAVSGTAALIEPASGAILGLASLPDYDPNFFWESTEAQRRNRFLTGGVVSGGLDGCLRQAAAFSEIRRLAVALTKKPERPRPDIAYLLPEKFKKKAYEQAAVLTEGPLAAELARLAQLPAGGVDLPAGGQAVPDGTSPGEAAATPMQLLLAFSTVLNGGSPITPHLLSGVWDRGGKRELAAKFSVAEQTPEAAATRQALLDILMHLGQPGPAGSVLLEAMVSPEGQPPLTEKLAGLPPGGAATDLEANYLLLAAVPQAEPVFAMLVVLHQADFARLLPGPGDSLPRAAMGPQFIEPLLALSRSPRSAAAPASPLDMEKIKKIKIEKRNEQVHNMAPPTEEFRGLRMPEVTGKSLRHGLQSLQEYNLRISVVGSGLIVAQHPRAGTSFKPGDACVLKLQTEQ